MAFEFLGGELRCGRPWHPYGVEYALPTAEDGTNQFNSPCSRWSPSARPTRSPSPSYDPVGGRRSTTGRPRHADPRAVLLAWLERAHHGGLRMMTNLLVDNTALCQLYPVKKNSCNEMDGVRLQAQRLFEFQDYIDAQSGGPGEGWFASSPPRPRPAQVDQRRPARRRDGHRGVGAVRLRRDPRRPAVHRGEIDERLEEVYDMGVRQMELVNKFDNALSGVTGDGGTTGLVVNGGNKSSPATSGTCDLPRRARATSTARVRQDGR
jgi:hypothetical protein